MVRIHKNMRNKLVAANALSAGVDPSYYIESLLYNAPMNCLERRIRTGTPSPASWRHFWNSPGRG